VQNLIATRIRTEVDWKGIPAGLARSEILLTDIDSGFYWIVLQTRAVDIRAQAMGGIVFQTGRSGCDPTAGLRSGQLQRYGRFWPAGKDRDAFENR